MATDGGIEKEEERHRDQKKSFRKDSMADTAQCFRVVKDCTLLLQCHCKSHFRQEVEEG